LHRALQINPVLDAAEVTETILPLSYPELGSNFIDSTLWDWMKNFGVNAVGNEKAIDPKPIVN
jgi:hypothetical protein